MKTTMPARRPTLTEEAYQTIKRRIINLDLLPGMPFTEVQLAMELSLSKTPVREALGWLQREGLVELSVRSRYRVAPVTLKDVRDLFSLRLLLDGEAASLAASHMTDAAQLQALEELSQIGYDPRDHASIAQFLSVNTRFHTMIARAGGNNRLAAALEQVIDQMERLFHMGLALTSRAEENVREHQQLVRAIMRGDAEQARDVAIAHTRASQTMVIDSLLSSEELLSTNVTTITRRDVGVSATRFGSANV